MRLLIASIVLVLGLLSLVACSSGATSSGTDMTPSPSAPTLTVQQSAYIEALATAQAVGLKERQDAAIATAQRPTPNPYYDLKFISFTWHHDYGFATVEGFVENTSGKRLENIEAVAIFNDASGTPIASGSALLEYNFLLPGQRSPFTIVTRYNPAMEKCSVEFKEFSGSKLKTDYAALP